jgi:hypothetical protein
MAVLHGEVEAMGDMFMRMNRQCYEKCINPSVSEGRGTGTDDLSLDDENCVAICTGTRRRMRMYLRHTILALPPCPWNPRPSQTPPKEGSMCA